MTVLVDGRGETTMTATLNEADPRIAYDDWWPTYGTALTAEQLTLAVRMMTDWKLKRHWHCLEKAYVVKDLLKGGRVVIGSAYAVSIGEDAEYGHEFNPPYEFHAWWMSEDFKTVIDLGLPGLIENGLRTRDDEGPALVGREPCILAITHPPDRMPKWLRYKAYEVRK